MGLGEAVEYARKIYLKDGMHPLDRESAVQHIGYKSLNGASATALASLKQFGLTADAGTGMLRLTDLALDILEPTSVEAERGALMAAAFSPDLFASLRERFPDKPPSESNLRAHLVRQGFTTAAVKSIVPAYLETHAFVGNLEVLEQASNVSELSQVSPFDQAVDSNRTRAAAEILGASIQAAPPSAHSLPAIGTRRMVFDTEEGEAVFTFPDGLSEASIDDLEEWFALVVKRLRRTSKQ
jgi:hypothetical protein